MKTVAIAAMVTGLATGVWAEIWASIHDLKQSGDLSILVVDKSLKELAIVADQAVVIARGETVWSGPMDMLDADMRDRYLGV